jgi:hypothetical protein
MSVAGLKVYVSGPTCDMPARSPVPEPATIMSWPVYGVEPADVSGKYTAKLPEPHPFTVPVKTLIAENWTVGDPGVVYAMPFSADVPPGPPTPGSTSCS